MKTIYGEAEKIKYCERVLQDSGGWYIVFQNRIPQTYITDIRPVYYPQEANILRIKHIAYTFVRVE